MKQDRLSVVLALAVSLLSGCTTSDDPPVTPIANAGSGGTAGGGAGTGNSGTGNSAGAGAGGNSSGGIGGQAVGGGGAGGVAGGGGGGAVVPAGLCGSAANPCPTLLSETGLYSDTAAKTLAPGVMPFKPQFQLWSDAAEKYRWVQLPEGATINTSNMDFWTFPAGTKLWKEFRRDNVPLETRILWKQGAGAADWFMMAFKWNAAGTDAEAVPDGEPDTAGTTHDIPSTESCSTCHRNMRDRAIGFSAIQLAYAAEVPNLTLDQLATMGALSVPPAGPITVPGTAVDQAALGYMHANCGMCHNNRSNVFLTKLNDMDLWLQVGALASVETTPTYMGLVNMDTKKGNVLGATKRVTPGDLANSALYQVMNIRDAVGGVNPGDAGAAVDGGDVAAFQMPPLGTEIVDPVGLAAIEAWINALPPP